MQIQDLTSQSLFTELSENEMSNIVGGYGWSDFKRQAGNVARKAGNAASDFGKGGKDGVRGDQPRLDTISYNVGYSIADILDN